MTYTYRLISILCVMASLLAFTEVNAGNQPYKARLSVDYVKLMDNVSYIEVSAKFKGENGYEPAIDLPLNVYQLNKDDSLVFVSMITTDGQAIARLNIEVKRGVADSVVASRYVIKIEDNEKFKDAKKSISFIDASLIASIVEKDSINFVEATLTDATGAAIKGQKIKVWVHRLFAPLQIGETIKTDKQGSIAVSLENAPPGIGGMLMIEVSVESKKYGTIKNIFDAQVGAEVMDLSTYNQRTMWSPPSMTPWYIWVFPNLIILGIWGTIFFLIRNLTKIYYS